MQFAPEQNGAKAGHAVEPQCSNYMSINQFAACGYIGHSARLAPCWHFRATLLSSPTTLQESQHPPD